MRIKLFKYKYRLPFVSIIILVLIPVSMLQAQTISIDEVESTLIEKQDAHSYYKLALKAIENKEYDTAETYLRKVLAEDSRYQEPSGKSAWYQLGITLERQDEKFAAIEVLEQGLDTLKSAGLNDWYLNYDLARMYAENRIEERESEITKLVYEVLQNISPEKQPDLWQRIVDIINFFLSESERAELEQSLSEPDGKPGMVLFSFFRREDPNPITEYNELITTIFQRAAEARERFTSSSSPRGYDERGDIYVRLGRPWKMYPNHSGLLGEVGYMIYPYEIWLYTHIHPELYFTFIRERGVGDYEMVGGPESILGTFYRGRRAFFDKLQAGRTATYLRLYLYEELAALHETFRQRFYKLREQYTTAEAADYARTHFVNEDRNHAALLDTLIQSVGFNIYDVYESLPLELSSANFRGESGKTYTEFYYAIQRKDLFFDRNDQIHTTLQGQIGIFDENFALVASDSLEYYVTVPSSKETKYGAFISQWNVSLQPGGYNLYFHIKNPNGKKQTTIHTPFQLEPFPESGLFLSDIQLALDIQPSKEQGLFHKKGYFIKPKPGNSITIGRPFFVYFEIYRLSTDSEGKTNYQIEYTLQSEKIKRRFLGLLGRTTIEEQVYYESVQRGGQESTQPEYHKLDFGDLKKGEYQLKVLVRDLNSGQEASSDFTISLVE